jgi:hypothetical protein
MAGTVHRARATPLVSARIRRLKLQQPQYVSHLNPLADQSEVYAGHRVTSPPANREEEPVLELPDWTSLANRADSTVRLSRGR